MLENFELEGKFESEHDEVLKEYQPSGAGGTRPPPATPHRLQHLTACFIQNGRRGPKIGQTLGYWILRLTFTK